MAYTSASAALANTQIVEVIPKRKDLVVMGASGTVTEALKLMKERNITAVPVFEGPSACPWAGKCLGWLDLRSIMLYLAWGKFKVDHSNPAKAPVFDQAINFGNTQVKDLLPLSPENETAWVFGAYKPVRELLEAFSKGVHRALVAFPAQDGMKDHRTELATQTDVVRWIFHSHTPFAKCLHSTVAELGLAARQVHTIRDRDSALDGFRKAAQLDLGAIAIVNEEDKLVGNLSASDLRGIDVSQLHTLTLTVRVFLEMLSPRSLKPQVVTAGSSLRAAMQLMLQNRQHRVWIIDPAGKPIGVCSMTDVCYCIMMEGLQGK